MEGYYRLSQLYDRLVQTAAMTMAMSTFISAYNKIDVKIDARKEISHKPNIEAILVEESKLLKNELIIKLPKDKKKPLI
ncbi:MAG: hypothetical protein ACP5OA_07585 [Candidatus Woesearchaeota archaeon]